MRRQTCSVAVVPRKHLYVLLVVSEAALQSRRMLCSISTNGLARCMLCSIAVFWYYMFASAVIFLWCSASAFIWYWYSAFAFMFKSGTALFGYWQSAQPTHVEKHREPLRGACTVKLPSLHLFPLECATLKLLVLHRIALECATLKAAALHIQSPDYAQVDDDPSMKMA